MYELMMEMAWHPSHVNASSWLAGYVERRYHTSNSQCQRAWQILHKAAYSKATMVI